VKDKKKYDILDGVKNFPKVKTSDSFMDNLHSKLEKVIEEENNPADQKISDPPSIKKKSFSDYLADLFSKRYLVPAFGVILLILLIAYLFKGSDNEKITAENELKNSKETVQEETSKVPVDSKEKGSKNPLAVDPITKGKIDSITSPIIENPKKELNKFIAKGKDAAEVSKKYFSAQIKEIESELKLFKPDEIIKNFGSFAFTLDPGKFRSIELRSSSYDVKGLKILKDKIDSISK